MSEHLAPVAKALAGALAAALAFAIPVVDDGLAVSEVLGVTLAFLGGLGIVYAAPANRPRRPRGQRRA